MCYILIKNYLERCFINNIIASNWKNVEKQEQITVGQILSRGVQFTDSPENSNVLWQAPPHASHIYSMVKKNSSWLSPCDWDNSTAVLLFI